MSSGSSSSSSSNGSDSNGHDAADGHASDAFAAMAAATQDGGADLVGANESARVPLMSPAAADAAAVPTASGARHGHGFTNATAVLQQARAGLTTALREVRSCRAAKAKCEDDLSTCRSGSSAGDRAEATELALQKAKGDYAALQKRATEVAAVAQQQLNELKTRLQRATGENDACQKSL